MNGPLSGAVGAPGPLLAQRGCGAGHDLPLCFHSCQKPTEQEVGWRRQGRCPQLSDQTLASLLAAAEGFFIGTLALLLCFKPFAQDSKLYWPEREERIRVSSP